MGPDDTVYACTKCGQECKEEDQMDSHMNTHMSMKHNETFRDQDFKMDLKKCPPCGVSFKDSAALNLHMKNVHGETEYSKIRRYVNVLTSKDKKGKIHACTPSCVCKVPPERKKYQNKNKTFHHR
jgi:predicted small metal-binding protein